MNGTIFWRLVWKEYRVQRALWFSIVVLTLLLQCLVLLLSDRGDGFLGPLFALPVLMAALYALGCGATLFATERETGTYEFQRSVPVASSTVFWGKVALALASTAAIAGLLWMVTYAIAGSRWPAAEPQREIWGMLGLGAAEALAWGVLFSLITSRPLVAAILAIAAASSADHVMAQLVASNCVIDTGDYLRAIPLRLVVLAVVAVADILLGRRWLGKMHGPRRWAGAVDLPDIPAAEAAASTNWNRPTCGRILMRLAWQQGRQSQRMLAAVAVLAVVLVFVWCGFHNHVLGGFQDNTSSIRLTTAMAALLAALVGVTVFMGDQEQERFRFLAERGVQPTYVWLTRLAVAAPPLLAILCVAVPAAAFAALAYTGPRIPFDLRYGGPWLVEQAMAHGWVVVGLCDVVMVCVSTVSAFAAGQLTSMFFRSGILAAVFGVTLAGMLTVFIVIVESLGSSSVWAVLPIAGILLLATWTRCGDWLRQRNGVRAWLRVALVLGVPIALLLAAIPEVRVEQVPTVKLGFSPEEYLASATPEGRATADLYQRALDLYVPMRQAEGVSNEKEAAVSGLASPIPEPGPPANLEARRTEWIKANEKSLALAIEASQRAECDFYDPARLWTYSRTRDLLDLGRLVANAGEASAKAGRLDEAGDRYLAAMRISRHMRRHARDSGWADGLERLVYEGGLLPWSVQPGQTHARVAHMLRELDEVLRTLPSRCETIETRYIIGRRVIEADPDSMALVGMEDRDIVWQTCVSRWLPSERERATRVLGRITSEDLRDCRNKEQQARENGQIAGWPYPFYFDEQWRFEMENRWQAPLREWPTPLLAWMDRAWQSDVWKEASWIETDRRVTRLVLALEAWRLEHGQLPESLEVLTGPGPDHYFRQLPVDPTTGKPFRYFPTGLPFPVESLVYLGPQQVYVAANTPLVAGSSVELNLGGGPFYDQYRHYGGWVWESQSNLARTGWRARRLQPLPQSAKK
jgi:ABC-type transport system involved in multi-copper enzyme maturation permease subunit